jgi:hypothetical protein
MTLVRFQPQSDGHLLLLFVEDDHVLKNLMAFGAPQTANLEHALRQAASFGHQVADTLEAGPVAPDGSDFSLGFPGSFTWLSLLRVTKSLFSHFLPVPVDLTAASVAVL